MTKAELIAELESILDLDEGTLQPQTELKQFEGWDSTAVLQLIVLFDDVGVSVPEEKFPDCETVQDVLDLGGGALT